MTSSNQWQSTIIDLYNNNSYKNYSTIKSFYGQEFDPNDWTSNQKYVWSGFNNDFVSPKNTDPSTNAYNQEGIITPITQTDIGSYLNMPMGITSDTHGNVYIADSNSQRVVVVAPDGTQTMLAGFLGGAISDITLDKSGNVYITKTFNGTIAKISPTGIVSTVASGFYNPNGIAIDTSGNLFVADSGNHRIVKIAPNSTQTILMSGSSPVALAIDGLDNLYITDSVSNEIVKLAKDGSQSVVGTGFTNAQGITVDTLGNIYVVDSINNTITKVNSAGTHTSIGQGFNHPKKVHVDRLGNLYATDGNGTYRAVKIALNSHRYIDNSGPINVVNYSVTTSFDYPGNITLDLYSSKDSTLYLDEWSESTGYTQSGGINLIDVDRYLILNFNFDFFPGNDAVIYLRIEIGSPIIAPKYGATKTVLNRFPEWMAIREYDDEFLPVTRQIDKPISLGGGVINAVSGEWLEDLNYAIQNDVSNRYIDTVDLTQMAWCYKTSGVPKIVYSIVGDPAPVGLTYEGGTPLGLAYDQAEFNAAQSTEYVAWWDEKNQVIYSNTLFNLFVINGAVYEQAISHVWNALDELGLMVDLPRLSGEINENYQSRIYDVFRNPLGVGLESFKFAIRRELNMWSLYGSTPSSDYVGATPEVISMADIEKDPQFMQPNGLPTSKFLDLANKLATRYPTTWGYLSWDKMLWDTGGSNYSGYSVLPKAFDATPLSSGDTQTGVGGGDDLLVTRPDTEIGPQDFRADIILRGKQSYLKQLYPAVNFNIEVQGIGSRKIYNNPPVSSYFTLEITFKSSPDIWFSSFEMTNTNAQDTDTPGWQDSPPTAQEIIGANGFINPDFEFQSKDMLNPQITLNTLIDTRDVDTLSIRNGLYTRETGVYTDYPANDIFRAWLSNDIQVNQPNRLPMYYDIHGTNPLHILDNLSSNPIYISNPGSGVMDRLSLLMLSTDIVWNLGSWESEVFTIPVSINGGSDLETFSPVNIQMPKISWDSGVISANYKIKIASTSGTTVPSPAAVVTPHNRESYLIDPSYIEVEGLFFDGSSAGIITQTVVGGQIVIGEYSFSNLSITSLSFYTNNTLGPLYPVMETFWFPFTSSPYQVSGTVDANGPWINGFAQALGEGNSDVIATLNLNRDDFMMPGTNPYNYMINWIGITTNDSRVVAWLDCNTIVPLISDSDSVIYPNNSILEIEKNGHITFSPFQVHVKLVGGDQHWYPQVNSGTFFEGEKEYYLYSKSSTETLYADGPLQYLARQGAPIIIRTNEATPKYLRQVAFFNNDMAPDINSPTLLSINNTETVSGTGHNSLYVGYSDIYNIVVEDITYPSQIIAPSLLSNSSSDNIVRMQSPTDVTHTYSVTYTVRHSFYANNLYIDNIGGLHTYLVFDTPPTSPYGYVVDYETSIFNTATPISIPLNPLYSDMDEGFLFIGNEDYPLASLVVEAHPKVIVANAQDYLYITINSLDTYGNPKPHQQVNLSASYGVFIINGANYSTCSLTTDGNGYVSIPLYSTSSLPAGAVDPISLLSPGSVTISSGSISVTKSFLVQPQSQPVWSIYATVARETIPADFLSQNMIIGKVVDQNGKTVSGAGVSWARGRSNFEMFSSTNTDIGTATTDNNGRFQIGPFNSRLASGYWFVSVSTISGIGDKSTVGDVVYWYEYSASIYGVDNMNGLPLAPIQDAAPINSVPPYGYGSFYPISYSEGATPRTTPVANTAINPLSINTLTGLYDGVIHSTTLPYPPPYVNPNTATPSTYWVPPSWYGMPLYTQYQLGLLYSGDRHSIGGDI